MDFSTVIVNRLKICYHVIGGYLFASYEEFERVFMKADDLEREVEAWERMAATFLQYMRKEYNQNESTEGFTPQRLATAVRTLLAMAMKRPIDEIIEGDNDLTQEDAHKLAELYLLNS